LNKEKHFSIYSLFIWCLAILFFFYEFFLRILPGTIAKDIIHSLDMSIEQFAIIGSAYYLTYSFMQIPVGILLDRFPVRLLVTIAAAMCAFGTLWFSFAQGFVPAFIGRLLIGLGSSFGFISLMIVTLNWFPRQYFAFLIGCGQFLGAMGPLFAGAPIALMMRAVHGDWRIIFLWVALFGIVLTILIGLFLKGKPKVTSTIVFVDRRESLGKRVRSLLTRSQIWWTLAYSATIYVALPVLGAFWGTSYLETRGLSKLSAAFVISMLWVGLAVGSPVFGKLSDLMKRRKPLIFLCAVIGVLSSLIVLFTPSNNKYYLSSLFFFIGIAGSGQNLSFALISEHAPKAFRATALALNNTAIAGFAAIIPLFVTSIIQQFTKDGQLTELAFEKGLIVIPICFAIASLISFVGIKETFCRQQNVIHQV